MQQHNVVIRKINRNDAENVVDLMKSIDSETDFLRYVPGERQTPPARIEEIANEVNEVMFVAEIDSILVGYILVTTNSFKKKMHNMDFVVAVKTKFRGEGIGKELIKAAEDWGRTNNKHRIEITVNTRNNLAFEMYKRLGYVLEGLKKDVTLIDGKYTDDYIMAKFI